MILQANKLTIGYSANQPIAGPLDLAVETGQLICLLGPNGAGKSTLLRTLAGLQHPLNGTIETGPLPRAKQISLVLTDPVRDNNLTVYSLVALGRYPYSNWLGVLRESDHEAIKKALATTGMEAYAERKMHTLSDGECQKVMLARALAQDTPLMMLDEPTAHLDLPSRIQLMQLLHELARETGKAIIVSTHELDLALQVADEVWLLQKGGRLDKGAPEDLVLNGIFSFAFDKAGVHFDAATGAFNIYPGQLHPIRLIGDGIPFFWTRRALRRNGFLVADAAPLTVRIIQTNEAHPQWQFENGETTQTADSITGLLTLLH